MLFFLFLTGGFCAFTFFINTQQLPHNLRKPVISVKFLTDLEQESVSGPGKVVAKTKTTDE